MTHLLDHSPGLPRAVSAPQGQPIQLYRDFGKRTLDVLLVLLLAPLALAVIGLLALLVRLGGGTALYAQPRMGRGGKTFRCWKLRTMASDADKALDALLKADPKAAEEWRRRQKLRNDPRVTSIGRFLRKTKLDELPQLWNVLCGEMSLVGPRPFMPEQRSLYQQGNGDAPYYLMRPGITGTWQVGSGNDSAFTERSGYDSTYWRELNLWLDLVILFKTIGVVLRARGN